jgi:Tol biopolymer transport system component
LFALWPAADSLAASKRLELADLAAIVRVSDPQLSPDGRSIVFVLARPNVKEARYDKSLVLVDVANGSQRILTYGRRGVASPRWSPTGDRIAFIDAAVPTPEEAAAESAPAGAEPGSNSDLAHGEPKDEVFVMPMNGGDAHRITSAPRDVEQFAWSPDGSQIAYATADENPNKKELERHNDAFEVGDNDFLAAGAAMPSHVWLVSANGGAARRLSAGTWSLPKGAPPSSPASPLSWSPDGKSIAIVQQATPNWGDSDLTVIATLDVASGQTHKLTAHKAFEGYPLYSPDGSSIAYWYSRDGDPNNENDLFVTGGAGGDGVDLTRVLDRDIVRAIWAGDGQSLVVAAHDGARVALWIQPRSGPARRLDVGDVDAAWSFWARYFGGPCRRTGRGRQYALASQRDLLRARRRRRAALPDSLQSRDRVAGSWTRGGISLDGIEWLCGGRRCRLSAGLQAGAKISARALDPWGPAGRLDAFLQRARPVPRCARLHCLLAQLPRQR